MPASPALILTWHGRIEELDRLLAQPLPPEEKAYLLNRLQLTRFLLSKYAGDTAVPGPAVDRSDLGSAEEPAPPPLHPRALRHLQAIRPVEPVPEPQAPAVAPMPATPLNPPGFTPLPPAPPRLSYWGRRQDVKPVLPLPIDLSWHEDPSQRPRYDALRWTPDEQQLLEESCAEIAALLQQDPDATGEAVAEDEILRLLDEP